MTSLTAEAASFFSGRGSDRKGQSSPEDVACGIYVGVDFVSTLVTSEHRLADAVGGADVPAVGTRRTRVPGVHEDHLSSSFLRFGNEDVRELCPARVGDRSVQATLGGCPVGEEDSGAFGIGDGLGSAYHVGDPEVLNADHVVASDELSGCLVVEVSPAIGDLSVTGGNGLAGCPAVGRARLFSGKDPLGGGKSVGRSSCPSGVVDVLSIGSGEKAHDSQINAHCLVSRCQGLDRDLVSGEHHIPPATFSLDRDRLDPPGNTAVGCYLYMSNSLEVDTGNLRLPLGAVAVFGPLNTVETVGGFESRVAGDLAIPHPAEEGVKSLVEAAQGGLLGGERPLGDVGPECSDLGELRRLSVVGNADLTEFPRVSAFLEGRIVELAVGIEILLKCDMLSGRRAQRELVGTSHAASSQWCSMYLRTVDSDTYPTDAAKYDFDHNTGLRPSQGNSARNACEGRPLNGRTTSAGESVARPRTKMYRWSPITSLATISQPWSSAIFTSSPFNRAATRPPIILRRYFEHHTTCRPRDVTPPQERRNRAVDIAQSLYGRAVTSNRDVGLTARAPIPLTAEAASPLGAD